MSLRFASLGSGSRGNALLVESSDTLLMVDCGLPRRVVEERLRALGRHAAHVAAVLITHEHGDHIDGIGPFQRRYGTPVWSTLGTAGSLRGLHGQRSFSCHRTLTIGAIDVQPFPVPHDAREPCQFVFSAGGRKLGLMTDTGHVTAHIRERLLGCDALAVEANHDLDKLHSSTYPDSVKSRVGSKYGHLNNAQTAGLLEEVGHGGLQWVAGLHLSERCNSPALVRASLEPVLNSSKLHLAAQDTPSDWLEIE